MKNSDFPMHDLHRAVLGSDVQRVGELLENKDSNLNEEDSFGRTALDLATIRGKWEIARKLLEAGANPNNTPLVPLAWAVYGGDKKTVKMLLEKGAKMEEGAEMEEGVMTLIKLAPGSIIGDKDIWDILEIAENESSPEKMSCIRKELEHKHKKLDELFLRSVEKGKTEEVKRYLGENPNIREKINQIENKQKQKALHLAAKAGHEEIVKVLVSEEIGAELGVKDKHEGTPLHLAAEHDRWKVVSDLSSETIRDVQDNEGRTALHRAVEYGRKEAVQSLMAAGVNPNIKDHKKRTALHRAVEDGHKGVVGKLLEAKKDSKLNLNEQDDNGRTALHLAVKNYRWKEDERGHEKVELDPEIMESLLDAEADPNVQDNDGRTPLHLAMEEYDRLVGKHEEQEVSVPSVLMGSLLDAEADPKVKDNDNRTPIHMASAAYNNEVFLKILLPKVSKEYLKKDRDVDGNTILHLMTCRLAKGGEREENQIEKPLKSFFEKRTDFYMTELLARGIEPEVQNKFHQTVLHFAAYSNPSLLKELLNRKDSKKIIDLGCECGLHTIYNFPEYDTFIEDGLEYENPNTLVSVGGYYDAVNFGPETDRPFQELEEEEGTPSAFHTYDARKIGVTPLHLAVRRGVEELVRPLLDAEANLESVDGDGQTPLHWTAVIGHASVAADLLKRGANVNAKDALGNTSLHWAAKDGHEDVVKTLLKEGADRNARNNEGLTPLGLAEKEQLVERDAAMEKRDAAMEKLKADIYKKRAAIVELLRAQGRKPRPSASPARKRPG